MKYPGSLHNHTDDSNRRLRDSINRAEDLAKYAIELGHEVLAYTEHESIGNAVKVEKIYNKLTKDNPNFKIIRGNEIYLCRNGLNQENFVSGKDKYYHFILLAKDKIGFEQLCELSTRAWMRSYMSRGMRRVPTYYEDIEEIIGSNPGHIIGSTACLGSALGTQLLKSRDLSRMGQLQEAYTLERQVYNWCIYLRDIFGADNFYLEMQPSAYIEQEYVNKKILEISNELNIPYIITTDSHYLKKEDAPIHKAYLNSQDGDREVDAFYATTYMMDTEELESYLTYLTREQLDNAYKSIIEIKNKCEDYTILKPLKIPSLKWKIPKLKDIPKKYYDLMPALKTFTTSEFNGDGILARAIVERIMNDETLQNAETYAEVNDELLTTWKSSEVNNAHWSAYYLNLQKIIDVVWEAGSIVGPGRGSGVGFLLLYILDITQINPLRETTKTFAWRFLNPDRVSVLDVDFDISGLRRGQVLEAFRREYGEDRVANVVTYGTEKSKSAILTAARGLGIDVDAAQYLASLIPSDRGIVRTLKQCYYGDPDNGFKPIYEFVNAMDSEEYQMLWEVAQKIEGLVCRTGIHAGGVIFVDEPFTKSTALMRAPDGTIVTQFDLHDCEDVSLIKYDALSVEAMDKIQICIELLQEQGFIGKELSIKEAYKQSIGVYNLERNNKDMWKMVWNHEILSLFQMEQQSGIQGIALSKPESVDDLATLNSAIRLMAQDKDAESPLEKFARFKKDISLWYQEMDDWGITKEEQAVLEPIIKVSYGLCISQEGFMQLVQLPECGGFSLTWADKLRKSIAKKNPTAFDELTKEFYKNAQEKRLDLNFCHYVWDVLISMNKGYGFNASHTLAYSIVGLQEMNLAFKYPIIFWNCANLIVNSGGGEDIDKNVDYAKMAKALGDVISQGIKVSLIDINKSSLTFKPDVENNQILFGMKALSGVNNEIFQQIIENRPYQSFYDFLNKVKIKKPAMISLIKGGAFDVLEAQTAKELGLTPRKYIMGLYLMKTSEPKKKLNLQNFNGLMQRGMIPESLNLQQRIFVFNKYLRTYQKQGDYYILDEPYLKFYSAFFNMDKVNTKNGIYFILQKEWDKIYKNEMDAVRTWLTDNQEEVLNEFNFLLFKDEWEKYAEGSISAWEMKSLCFYYNEHELKNVNIAKYGVEDFEKMPTEPEVDYYFTRGGKKIPIFTTHKIVGTVIAKDDNHSLVTILTTTGVVNVKFTKEYYAKYKKQISEVQDGKKKVIEKSWFSRGTKIMVTGFRRGDTFVAKSYKNTPTHQLYKILSLDEYGNMDIVHERKDGIAEDEQY